MRVTNPALVRAPTPAGERATNREKAALVGRIVFGFNVALTLYWVYALVSGDSTFFSGYLPTIDNLLGILDVWIVATILWGLIWSGVKWLLLRRFVGFSTADARRAFRSRMSEPFVVTDLTDRYSERRIRIADMIGRRGRTLVIAASSFAYLYRNIAESPTADFATLFLGDQLLDAVVSGWIFLLLYRTNGLLGIAVFASQARIMDGVLARANCLASMTLWSLFKFVLVPIGARLADLFSPAQFAVVFALIWGSYLVTDAAAEIGGSLIGRQRIRVVGLGDSNRKSVAGTICGLAVGLTFCLTVVLSNGLTGPWIGLAITIAVSSSILELVSPRSTDDFTMATTNALICWAFGALVL